MFVYYRSIWVKEVSKTLAFHLELPGVVKDDVELVVQGQRLAVHARSNNVAYKWSTDVGAPVKVSIHTLYVVAPLTRLVQACPMRTRRRGTPHSREDHGHGERN